MRIILLHLIILTSLSLAFADPVLELRCANANNNTQVQLWFSEGVNPTAAANPANFSIPGLQILSSSRENNFLGVARIILQTSPMQSGVYTVEVFNMTSTSGSTMNPNQDTFQFPAFDQSITYYENLRWLGNSVGFGIWTIFTEPGNTIYNRIVSYIQTHQNPIGLNLNNTNYSIPGAQVADLIALQLPLCLSADPDIVIVEIGGNDWPSVPYNDYIFLMDQLFSDLHYGLPEAKIISANIYDAVLNGAPGGGGGYTLEQWNAAADSLGAIYEIPILDVYTAVLGHSEPNGWYISSDGLHPNTCGYVYLSTLGLDVVQKIPPKPLSFTASEVFPGYIQFDCQFQPQDNLTTAVQIYLNDRYFITIDREQFPHTVDYTDFNYQICSFRARSETDLFAPEIQYSAFTPAVSIVPQELAADANVPNSPNDCYLYPPSPNPFNSSTVITLTLEQVDDVKLMIFDILGREITRLETRDLRPGINQVVWDASGQASGVYFVRLEMLQSVGTLQHSATRKVILLK